MLDVIICANFGVEKLRGLGNTRGQIFEFLIEIAGHPYNSGALPCDVCERPPLKYTQYLVFAGTRIREPVQCRTRTRVYVNAALGRTRPG